MASRKNAAVVVSSFEKYLIGRDYSPPVFRDLFELYVRGLQTMRSTTADNDRSNTDGSGDSATAGNPQAVTTLKLVKKQVDTMVLDSLLPSVGGSFKKSIVNVAAASQSGAADPSGTSEAAFFPLYMTAPLQSHRILAAAPCDPHKRKDVIVDSDVFAHRNVVQPFYQTLRAAVARSQFLNLHRDLGELNHLRLVVPFSTLLGVKQHLFEQGVDNMERVESDQSLRLLQSYLAWIQRALTEPKPLSTCSADEANTTEDMNGEKPDSSSNSTKDTDLAAQNTPMAYWHRTPPLSHISFSQECDILIALLNSDDPIYGKHGKGAVPPAPVIASASSLAEKMKNRRVVEGKQPSKEEAAETASSAGSAAVPPLSLLMDYPSERLLQYTKYLQARNHLREQKARLLGGTEAAGVTIPVVLATANSSTARRAFQYRIPTDPLNSFASFTTTSLLSGAHHQQLQGMGVESKTIADKMKKRMERLSSAGSGNKTR